MAVGEESEISPADCVIVQEIYDNGHAQERFELELEQALEAKRNIIIIEPARLGEETARWITVGNCLHKTAVLTGASCLASPTLIPKEFAHFVSIPMGTICIVCAVVYGVSWQFDPCCKYQVEYDTKVLSRLPLNSLTTATPVVLVRKDDKYRRALHNLLAGLSVTYLAFKVYHWMRQ